MSNQKKVKPREKASCEFCGAELRQYRKGRKRKCCRSGSKCWRTRNARYAAEWRQRHKEYVKHLEGQMLMVTNSKGKTKFVRHERKEKDKKKGIGGKK